MVGVGGVDEAPFVVAFFGPGVGEINVEAIDGGIGDAFGDIGDGIGANYPDVGQVPPANPVNGKAVKFPCPFNPDKIGVGLRFCLVYQKCPPARANLDMDGSGTSENITKIKLDGRIGVLQDDLRIVI